MKSIVIFVPLNQEYCKKIVDDMKELPWIKDYKIHMLHIYREEVFPHTLGQSTFPEEAVRPAIQKEVIEYMQGMVKDLGFKDVEYSCTFEQYPKDAAIEFIKKVDANIAMTSCRHKRGIDGLFSSSFTDHLIKFSPSHVISVR